MTAQSKLALAGVAGLVALLASHAAILGLRPSDPTTSPIESFFFDTATTLPALHVALAVLVLFIRRHEIISLLGGRPAWIAGGLSAITGAALLAWAVASKQVDMRVDSLVLLLASLVLLLGGWRLLGRTILPLALLALARPWPPMVNHHAHESLQRLTGTLSAAIVRLVSPVERNGHLLEYSGRVFEVIEGCSGLRLEITLLTATLVYAAFCSRSTRQTWGVIGLALLLGPLLNAFRVVSIMLDPETEVAQVHSTQGLIFISLGIILIGVLDRLCENHLWPPSEPSPPISPPPERTDRSTHGALLATLLVSGAALMAALATPTLPAPAPSQSWALGEIREEMGAWRRTRSVDLDFQFLGGADFRDKRNWMLERNGSLDRAYLFVGTDDPRRRDISALSPKTRLHGPAWSISGDMTTIDLPGLDATAERYTQHAGPRRIASLHLRAGVGHWTVEALRWMWALDLRPGSISAEGLTARIDVPIDDRNPTRAAHRLDELQAEIERALERARPGHSLAAPR